MLYSSWLLCLSSIILRGEAADPRQKVFSVSDQAQQESLSINSQLEQTLASRAECHKLLTRFPHLVSLPGDSLYEHEQSHYWSVTQAVARPECRLTPTTTLEVSQLVQYLSQHEIDVAITSGGHSTVVGATNLHAGVTLDLSALSAISLAEEQSTVTFGPGTRWLDIYQRLDPLGMTVAGARAGSVGAGGFLLGGGISILAASRGWSCDTLTSIEVVLGNGTIVTANATHHADLFSSMKGIGTNFGVATSFTMATFPVFQLQSSVLQYQGHHFASLAHELSTFVEQSHQDLDASLDLSIIADQSGSFINGFLMATRFGKIAESKTLQPFFDMPHAHGYINNVRPQDIASTVDTSNPRGFRHARNTLTIRNDVPTLLAIFSAIEKEFLRKDLPGGFSYMPAMLLQPIYRAQLGGKVDAYKSRNALGLDEDTEPLLLISLEGTWSHPHDDTRITEHLTSLRLLLSEIANRHDALHPFVYPNYAAGDQDVFQGRDEEDLSRLRGVQREYDSAGYVRGHVRFPFRL